MIESSVPLVYGTKRILSAPGSIPHQLVVCLDLQACLHVQYQQLVVAAECGQNVSTPVKARHIIAFLTAAGGWVQKHLSLLVSKPVLNATFHDRRNKWARTCTRENVDGSSPRSNFTSGSCFTLLPSSALRHIRCSYLCPCARVPVKVHPRGKGACEPVSLVDSVVLSPDGTTIGRVPLAGGT